MNDQTITILASGVALGVYLPALILEYQLRKRNVNADVAVIENMVVEEKKNKILDNKKAFHENFRLALTGRKMTKDMSSSFDETLTAELFDTWKKSNKKRFITYSGYWIPLLEKYREISGFTIEVDVANIDADICQSLSHFTDIIFSKYRQIWFWKWDDRRLNYEVPVTDQKPLSYSQRNHRFVIHGGGWGMGTYNSKISELESKGCKLDIVAYYPEEIGPGKEHRYFMIDPGWAPWMKNKNGRHEFPPMAEIKPGEIANYKNKECYHELFDTIREAKAIVSKPGGSTLADSLASATPIIMLAPFGEAEDKNAKIWEYLGFGISYENWKKSDFSMDILEKLHLNLINKGSTINYPDTVMKHFA
jgi:hypothetical protein